MNEAQIKHMVSRFLAWRLPKDFSPDNGIVYTRPNYLPNVDATPTGTNLFDGVQAEAMVRHMIESVWILANLDSDEPIPENAAFPRENAAFPRENEAFPREIVKLNLSEKDRTLSYALQSHIDDFERSGGDLDHAIMVMDFLQEIISWRFRGADESVMPKLADYMQARSERPTT